VTELSTGYVWVPSGRRLGLRSLQQLVVRDHRRPRRRGRRSGAVVAREVDALHVGLEVVDADGLPGLAGGRPVVLDADLDVVQRAGRDLGEEREALDGHVGGLGEVLRGLQLLRGLPLGEVHRDPVDDDEQPSQDHDDDQEYSQCAHLRCSPTSAVGRISGLGLTVRQAPDHGRPSSVTVSPYTPTAVRLSITCDT
jgi:hypothetical protein